MFFLRTYKTSLLEIPIPTEDRVLRKVGEVDGEWKKEGEDEIVKGTISRFSMPVGFFRTLRSSGRRDCRLVRKPGGGQRERVLRTEMKLLGESESRRGGAGEHRRRRETGQAFFGTPREERIDMSLLSWSEG